MKETNELLTVKFDEFSELLRKSNTEALVEVMKGVTLEFEKQMSALINKLIQENFEQLNQSVANMNQWQQENKEMIVSEIRAACLKWEPRISIINVRAIDNVQDAEDNTV